MNLKYTAPFVLFFLFAGATAYGQLVTPNIDFESGTTANWSFYTGTCCPINTPTSTPAITAYHRLSSGVATDYYGGFPVVNPISGSYSLRLGDSTYGARGARARYYVHIPSGTSDYSLIYHYAVVLQNPAHDYSAQPRMEIKAFDSATGVVIACDSFCYVADSSVPGFVLSTAVVGADVYYKTWTAGNMKFRGLGGHTVVIDAAAGGCDFGGHFGYGYLDMSAGLYANTVYAACSSSSVALNAPPGYTAYRWLDSATFTTVYDTVESASIFTPGVPTVYAVILTPYPGYGCIDTLYTKVIPIIPCSGTPAAAAAYARASAICGTLDTLTVPGFSLICGLTFQWQSSPDNITWANISGATSDVYTYSRPYTSYYYKCIVTCTSSGISTISSSVFVPGVVGPGLYAVENPPGTACPDAQFYVSTCGTSTAYSVATWYGDGTSDVVALTTTGVRHADITHDYGLPGTYSVKHILYDGTLAVDSAFYSFSYSFCSIIPLKFYFDKNNNCVKNSDEKNYLPIIVEVDSATIPIDTVSVISSLLYRVNGTPGTQYAFKVIPPPELVTTCPGTGIIYDTVQPYVNMYSDRYFGVNCVGGSMFDFRIASTTQRAAMMAGRGTIVVNNLRCLELPSTLKVNFSPKYHFVSSQPHPVSVVGNEVIWNLDTMNMMSHPINISYQLERSGPDLTPGDTVITTYYITPIVGDADTGNNVVVRVDTVLNACDPNYIEVTPQGCISSGTNLRYTIHFENTGNDTAFNVHVMDTLSSYLDVNSMRMEMSSHEMDLVLMNVGGYTIAKFDFPNINLLDSSHHGLCTGMFAYTINANAGLAAGTLIPNRVGIYFDYNEVVMTNTVQNVIGCPVTSVKELRKQNIEMFPNPTTNELTIQTPDNTWRSLTITNQVGQVVLQQLLTGTVTKVNTTALPAGVYFVTFKGNDGTLVQKLIKW